MLNESLKLNPELFNKDVKKVATRVGYGEGLVQAARENEAVVGLCADLTESTNMHKFAKEFPHRFIQMGVAEQNMAAVASGMAHMGKIPFIASYAMFSPGRNWEQVRTTICYNDAKVIIAGAHAGISVGPDGGTHQALEDIAMMRALPNMTIVAPSDYWEAKKATLAALEHKGPVYIRLPRESIAAVTTERSPFVLGRIEHLASGSDVTIVVHGNMAAIALQAEKQLRRSGVTADVLNASTLKPFDERALLRSARATGCVVTIEDHQRIGGLGSIVCDVLAQELPTPVHVLGMNDAFGQSGTMHELYELYGLTAQHVARAAHAVIAKK
jgi:transketolase